MLSERNYSCCLFLGRGSRLGIQNRRCLPDTQSKMPKLWQFRCCSVFSICYRHVQKAFIWCTVILRCLVLPIFSSGLKTMVSARHLTFFLDFVSTSIFWARTSAGTPHWGFLFIILRRELLQGIYQLVASSTCLTWIVSKRLYGSNSEIPNWSVVPLLALTFSA